MLKVLSFIAATVLSLFAGKPVTVKGNIVDAADGSPVGYASVILTDLDDKVLASASSADDGSFEISGLRAGCLQRTQV